MMSTSATSNAALTSEARPFLFVFKAGTQQPEQTTQLQQSDTSEATQADFAPASFTSSTSINSTASEESEGSSSANSSAASISEARPFLFVFKAGLQQPDQTTQQHQSDTSVATQAEFSPASCTSSTSISTAPEEFEGSSSDLQKHRQDDWQPCCTDSDDDNTISHDSRDENTISDDGDNKSTIGDGYHTESIISNDECYTVEAEDVRYTDASDTSSDDGDHESTSNDGSINHECTISDDDYESNGHDDLEPDHTSFDDGSSWDERASDISGDSFCVDDLDDGGASETSVEPSCDDGEGWEGRAPDISADSCCDDGDDDLDNDVDEVEYYHVIDDASDFEEPKYTSAVSFEFVDLSSATVELEPAGPPPELTPTECLTHLPTAVGLCPPNKPEVGLKVFKWGAEAICDVVIESYLAGGDPFEDGGIMQTAAAPAIVKLAKIRKEYQEDFDDECILLDFAIENLAAAEEEGEEMSFEVPCTPGAVTEDDGGGGGGGGGMDMVFGIRDSCAGLVVDKPSCRAGSVKADDDDGGDVDVDDMDVVDQQRGPMGMFEASVVQGEGKYYAAFLVFHPLYVQRDEFVSI
eukprot:jgi/Undpi1/2913/HiC_scaffold_14.g06290.m1